MSSYTRNYVREQRVRSRAEYTSRLVGAATHWWLAQASRSPQSYTRRTAQVFGTLALPHRSDKEDGLARRLGQKLRHDEPLNQQTRNGDKSHVEGAKGRHDLAPQVGPVARSQRLVDDQPAQQGRHVAKVGFSSKPGAPQTLAVGSCVGRSRPGQDAQEPCGDGDRDGVWDLLAALEDDDQISLLVANKGYCLTTLTAFSLRARSCLPGSAPVAQELYASRGWRALFGALLHHCRAARAASDDSAFTTTTTTYTASTDGEGTVTVRTGNSGGWTLGQLLQVSRQLMEQRLERRPERVPQETIRAGTGSEGPSLTEGLTGTSSATVSAAGVPPLGKAPGLVPSLLVAVADVAASLLAAGQATAPDEGSIPGHGDKKPHELRSVRAGATTVIPSLGAVGTSSAAAQEIPSYANMAAHQVNGGSDGWPATMGATPSSQSFRPAAASALSPSIRDGLELLYNLVKLGCCSGGGMKRLAAVLAAAVVQQSAATQLGLRALQRLAWAVGKLDTDAQSLPIVRQMLGNVVARFSEPGLLQSMSPVGLSVLLYGMGKAGMSYTNPAVWRCVVGAVALAALSPDVGPQALVNLASGLAQSRPVPAPTLVPPTSTQLSSQVPLYDRPNGPYPPGYAAATAEPSAYLAVAESAERQLPRFQTREVANLLGSLAALGALADPRIGPLLAASQCFVSARLKSMNAQDLAEVLFAYGTHAAAVAAGVPMSHSPTRPGAAGTCSATAAGAAGGQTSMPSPGPSSVAGVGATVAASSDPRGGPAGAGSNAGPSVRPPVSLWAPGPAERHQGHVALQRPPTAASSAAARTAVPTPAPAASAATVTATVVPTGPAGPLGVPRGAAARSAWSAPAAPKAAATAFTAPAENVSKDGQHPLWPQLEQRCLEQLPHCSTYQLVTMLWAFAHLGHRPLGLLTAVTEGLSAPWRRPSSRDRTGAAESRSSTPRRGHTGPKEALSLDLDSGSVLPSCHLARLVWALGKLDVALEDKALRCLCASLQCRLGEFDTQSLLMVAWGLAALRCPSANAPEALADRLAALLPSLTPDQLAMALWSAARLMDPAGGDLPALSWLNLLQASRGPLTAALPRMGPQSLAMTAWAHAAAGVQPGDAALQALWTRAATLVTTPDASPQALAMVTGAMAEFRCRHDRLTEAVLSAAGARMLQTVSTAAQLLAATAAAGNVVAMESAAGAATPPAAATQALQGVPGAGRAGAIWLSSMVCSLGRLGVRDGRLLDLACHHARLVAPMLTVREAVPLLWGLGAMCRPPSGEALATALDDARAAIAMGWSAAVAHDVPRSLDGRSCPPSLLTRLMAVVERVVLAEAEDKLGRVTHGSGARGRRAGTGSQLNGALLSMYLMACASHRYRPPAVVLEAVCALLRRHLPALASHTLCEIAWSLAVLRPAPPGDMGPNALLPLTDWRFPAGAELAGAAVGPASATSGPAPTPSHTADWASQPPQGQARPLQPGDAVTWEVLQAEVRRLYRREDVLKQLKERRRMRKKLKKLRRRSDTEAQGSSSLDGPQSLASGSQPVPAAAQSLFSHNCRPPGTGAAMSSRARQHHKDHQLAAHDEHRQRPEQSQRTAEPRSAPGGPIALPGLMSRPRLRLRKTERSASLSAVARRWGAAGRGDRSSLPHATSSAPPAESSAPSQPAASKPQGTKRHKPPPPPPRASVTAPISPPRAAVPAHQAASQVLLVRLLALLKRRLCVDVSEVLTLESVIKVTWAMCVTRVYTPRLFRYCATRTICLHTAVLASRPALLRAVVEVRMMVARQRPSTYRRLNLRHRWCRRMAAGDKWHLAQPEALATVPPAMMWRLLLCQASIDAAAEAQNLPLEWFTSHEGDRHAVLRLGPRAACALVLLPPWLTTVNEGQGRGDEGAFTPLGGAMVSVRLLRMLGWLVAGVHVERWLALGQVERERQLTELFGMMLEAAMRGGGWGQPTGSGSGRRRIAVASKTGGYARSQAGIGAEDVGARGDQGGRS